MRRILVFVAVAVGLAAAAGEAARTWRNPKDGGIYVRIPPGELAAEGGRFTFPNGFWMARTEVTVDQFRKFTRVTGYRTDAEKTGCQRTWRTPGSPQSGDHPVVWLSYRDALAYVHWAGVDLPTEAEWQYAARAGTTTKFYWGEEHDDRYMWHRENSPTGTHPVATKLPNPWGLYDIVGNAWEYCKVQTPDGTACAAASALLGASWTRCPRYKMRDGRMIDAIALAMGPVRAECPKPSKFADDNSWDDDRGLRCVRRISE